MALPELRRIHASLDGVGVAQNGARDGDWFSFRPIIFRLYLKHMFSITLHAPRLEWGERFWGQFLAFGSSEPPGVECFVNYSSFSNAMVVLW